MTKTCVNCQQEFSPKTKNQKYCSTECQKLHYAAIGRSSLPPTEAKRCLNCNNTFQPRYSTQKYCSAKCRTEHFNSQHIKSDKKEITCLECGSTFLPRVTGQKYCSQACYKAHYDKLRLARKESATCVICGTNFIPRVKTQLTCSKPCRETYSSQQQSEKYRLKKEAQIAQEITQPDDNQLLHNISKKAAASAKNIYANFDGLRLYSEEEFEEWFKHNYIMFGIAKLIKIDRMFPDVIAQTFTGNILRIELEFSASNFKAHGHDPSGCDLIVSYVKGPRTTSVRGVPVIAVFQAPGLMTGSTNMDHDKSTLTPYFRNLTRFFERHFQYFLANSESYDTAKQTEYELLFRSLLNSSTFHND